MPALRALRRTSCACYKAFSTSPPPSSSPSSSSSSAAAAAASPISSPQTFRVLGVQQIAIGGLDKQALHAFWGTLLGIKKTGSYRSEKENVDEDILVLGSGTNAVEIDLMQPLDPEKAPKVHMPALNHVGLWVDSLSNAVQELGEKGVRFAPGGVRRGASGFDVAFVHPKSATGVLLELVQAPEDVIEANKQQRGGRS